MRNAEQVRQSARAGNSSQGAAVNRRDLLRALQAMRDGDFSVRLPGDQVGIAGKIADTFNEIVASNQLLAHELERSGQIVGREGKTRHRMAMAGRRGAWAEMERSFNTLVDDLLWPTTEVTRSIAAVATGIGATTAGAAATTGAAGFAFSDSIFAFEPKAERTRSPVAFTFETSALP